MRGNIGYDSGYRGGYGGVGYGGSGYGGSGYSGSGFGTGTGFGGQEKMLLADKKKQALRYSYETLGNLLSTAENFAGLANQKYGSFNITNSYDYENLKSEFAWELHCFQRARQTYQKKFQCPYQFPNDLPPEKIIKDIKTYMEKTTNKNDIILYNCMINIINGDKINIDFEKLFEELDKNSNSKINPNKLRLIIGPLNQILDQQLDEADKGNMNLNLSENNHINNRENLRNITGNNSNILKIEIGNQGKLKNENNKYYFQPKSGVNKIEIKIDNPQFYNENGELMPSLYTYNNKKGKIYVLQKEKNKNYNNCFIFDGHSKYYNKDFFEAIEYFEYEDKKYTFGNIKIGNISNTYGLFEEYNKNMK